MVRFSYFDLFSGIGGFRQVFDAYGGTCLLSSDINPFSRKTYLSNYDCSNELFFSDVSVIDKSHLNLPKVHLLSAGFPCQPFSNAGLSRGFSDSTNGNLFFEILRLSKLFRPSLLFLENVPGILKINKGQTLSEILSALSSSGYHVHYKIIKASDFGLPQRRPRVYFLCFRNKLFFKRFNFPAKLPLSFTLSDVFNTPMEKEIGYTLRVGGRGSKINDRHNWDGYMGKNGKEYRIGVKEAKQMMGFPDSFHFPVSTTQAMKQLGNSVAVPVVREIFKELIKTGIFTVKGDT